jgi:hypothetical protein
MRNKEPWMANGAAVRCGIYTGIIRTMVECRIVEPILGGGEVEREKVMMMYVQPTGVQHAWPVGADRVESINALLSN